MSEYIPIPAFAERAGVTKQAVYARLDKDLSPYSKEIDGRKMLDIAALALYQVKQVDNQDAIKYQSTDNQESNKLTNYLTAEIERLRKEIETRDATIVYKDIQISSFAEKFSALSEKQTELIQREQEISARALATTGQAQLLHANTQEDPPRGNWFTRISK